MSARPHDHRPDRPGHLANLDHASTIFKRERRGVRMGIVEFTVHTAVDRDAYLNALDDLGLDYAVDRSTYAPPQGDRKYPIPPKPVWEIVVKGVYKI